MTYAKNPPIEFNSLKFIVFGASQLAAKEILPKF